MRAPNVFMVSVLMTTCTLPVAGQDQASMASTAVQGKAGMAPTVEQGINAEDGDPKPCHTGERTSLDAPHDSADKPAPQTTAKSPRPPASLSALSPAVPGPNPPRVIFPPGKPEPITLSDMYWEDLFIMIGFYNRFAEQAEKADNRTEAAMWRTAYQRNAGLNDAEGEILQEIAHDCNCAVREQDAKLRAEGEKFRAQIVPGATVTVSTEFYQLFEGRKTIIRDHVEQLRVALGDSSFKKLETYILSMYPVPSNVAQPNALSKIPAAKEQK